MTLRNWSRTAAALAAGLTVAACGSSSKDEAAVPGPGEVFANSFAPGLNWQFFGGSENAAGTASVDTTTGQSGASWKIEVPATGYVGGTVVASAGHDLSTFNALTFWAKASKSATLNVAGFGADQATAPYLAERTAIPVTTTWTKFVIPIPLASRLSAEKGLFHMAEGSDEGAYTLWFDDIRFESLAAAELGTAAPAIATESKTIEVGATFTVAGAAVVYTGGTAYTGTVTVAASTRYFTWASSDTAKATVDLAGVVTGVAVGSTDITAQLGTTAAVGTTTANVIPVQAPATAAPTPSLAPGDVIALYSNAYTPVAMAFWSPSIAGGQGWDDGTTVLDLQVAGNDVMKFSGLGFSVSEVATPVDTVTPVMTHFHIDLWSATAGDTKIKLVDYGADGVFAGGDDVEHEVTRTLAAGSWNSIELSFATDLSSLTTRSNVAQLVLSGANPTLFIDNVYFHK